MGNSYAGLHGEGGVIACLAASQSRFLGIGGGQAGISRRWRLHVNPVRIPYSPTKNDERPDMHKRKIDMSDEIFVINVGGYIGSSTRSEIEYAKAKGKAVRYLLQLK